MTKSLEGKVAIVTGAGSPRGTGHAMAIGLVRAGARVVMLDLSEPWLAESVADVQRIGGPACAAGIVADVSDREAIERAVGQTIEIFGGVHVLINNAGANPRSAGYTLVSKKFWDLPADAWDRVVAVNFSAAFYTTRAVIGHFLAQGYGRIIGVTTSLDTMYSPGKIPYGPSKAGHEAFVAAMGGDLEGTGVTANILVPGGPTNTNFLSSKKTEAERGALIQPEVMQAPAVWLASDASHACNGRRLIAYHWDDTLPIDERLARCASPAAWPQLGKQAILPRRNPHPA